MSEIQSKSFKARVITVSDSRSTGEREDTVGPHLVHILSDAGYETDKPLIVPDVRAEIARVLLAIVDDDQVDLVVTTGGTGLSPRDVTPEATRDVITYEIPGFAECMRVEGAQKTKSAWLSRGIAGVKNKSIIVNIPGSQRGAIQSLESLLPLIRHAIEIIRGEAHECGKKMGESDDIPAVFVNDDILNQQFNHAMKMLLKEKKISADAIQRELKIGYNKACRIIDMMEEKGVIEKPDKKKSRSLIKESNFLLNYVGHLKEEKRISDD